MKVQVHHVGISVENLETSMEFYSDVFGFEEVMVNDRPDLGGRQAIMEIKETNDRLELFDLDGKIESKDDDSNLKVLGLKHISFQVEDAEQFYEMTQEKGLTATEPKTGSTAKFFFLEDPDGNMMEIMQPL